MLVRVTPLGIIPGVEICCRPAARNMAASLSSPCPEDSPKEHLRKLYATITMQRRASSHSARKSPGKTFWQNFHFKTWGNAAVSDDRTRNSAEDRKAHFRMLHRSAVVTVGRVRARGGMEPQSRSSLLSLPS